MHLHTLMGWPGPMTHRQFLAWHAWRTMQWSRPSRDNWYQMQQSCEVRRVLSSKPNSIKPEQFKLEFTERKEEAQPVDPAQRTAWAKAVWLGAVGGKVRVRNPDGTLTEMKGGVLP